MARIALSIFFIFASLSYAKSASVAINSMNNSASTLKNTVEKQNNECKKIFNLSKKILMETKKSLFFVKQRNELILNAWRIEAESIRKQNLQNSL